ncbi:hypothetical protein L6452_32864 [Arctium lappa]|uniref:Uncharacterized protein n=1 Tax=Arctium lappa TaxID=4217 RepID=A0ACB8Z5Q1_ARCLA|nr:hypothetical protein L6452_32864 [Arctium lappa]
MQKGISASYDRWIYHGESCDVSDDGDDDISFNETDEANDDMNDDDLDEMLNNIGQSTWGDDWHTSGIYTGHFSSLKVASEHVIHVTSDGSGKFDSGFVSDKTAISSVLNSSSDKDTGQRPKTGHNVVIEPMIVENGSESDKRHVGSVDLNTNSENLIRPKSDINMANSENFLEFWLVLGIMLIVILLI